MGANHKPLLSQPIYLKRVGKGILIAVVMIAFSLGLGIAGYHFLGHLGFVDSLLNASMILTGMGLLDPMKTDAAKLFASFYALYSGVAFLTIAALLFGPVFHRFLHRFHLEIEDDADDKK